MEMQCVQFFVSPWRTDNRIFISPGQTDTDSTISLAVQSLIRLLIVIAELYVII